MRSALLLALMAALPPALGAGACPWPDTAGERLLARRVGSLSLAMVDVDEAVAELMTQSDLPLSFIHAESFVKISLHLQGATVRQALDAIVEQAPAYRYGIVGGHLVLYPIDPIWQTRLDDVKVGPGRRLAVTRDLAKELARRVPAFAQLAGPWVLGDSRSYTYTDVVRVAGPGSILELLIQLIGSRPSTVVLFDKQPGLPGASLSVSSRDQLRSIKATAPATELRSRGEAVQLRVIGTLKAGGEPDLSAGACGTIYTVSDERVLSVGPDGMVSARASGKAEVKVSNEHASAWVTFKVTLPEPPASPSPSQAPPP